MNIRARAFPGLFHFRISCETQTKKKPGKCPAFSQVGTRIPIYPDFAN